MAEVFILLILIFVNGLFVMGEIALVSARRSKLESLANKGDEKARKTLDLVENPEKFLSTAQIGITLIAILTGVYSGEKFGSNLVPFFQRFSLTEPYADTIATTIIVILVTFLSILFGELIPKKIGLLKAEKDRTFGCRTDELFIQDRSPARLVPFQDHPDHFQDLQYPESRRQFDHGRRDQGHDHRGQRTRNH